MTNKKATTYRLGRPVVDEINRIYERSGRSKTCIIEDSVMFKRQFGEEAEAVLKRMADKYNLHPRKVIEVLLLKAGGAKTLTLPFNLPLAA